MALCFYIALWLNFCFWTSAGSPPIATVLNGTYEGQYLPGFNQDLFLGIPYAQNTGGHNRFRIPQSLTEAWNDTRLAKTYGHACPGLFPELDSAYGMSEDCLSINIVRPAGLDQTSRIPVMFWIYGGSYQVGTSSLPSYNLSYIVERSVNIDRPVLGVSINYRKAAWGNLFSNEVLGSGNTNLALRDMRKALTWVSENIVSFGGNPDLVTIWGESSGAFAVGQLLIAYGGRTDGLFHRSIQQSGSATSTWCNGTDWYQPVYDDIVAEANCSDAIDTLDCLRIVPYEQLFSVLNMYPLTNGGPGWYPTVDGDILPMFPTEALRSGKFAKSVPHLCGVNTDEGTASTPAGGVFNTDDEIIQHLKDSSGFRFPASTIEKIMQLYPDDPSFGIPANIDAQHLMNQGRQYKRIAAILGDTFYHAPHQQDVKSYVEHAENGSKTYVYRFNTRGWMSSVNTSDSPTGSFTPIDKGVTHAAEIPFVFNNPDLHGPWLGYQELSIMMNDLWINFAYDGNPNGMDSGIEANQNDDGLSNGMHTITYAHNSTSEPQTVNNVNITGARRPYWPAYDEHAKGLNLVLQTQGQGGPYVETDTYRHEGRDYLSLWAKRRRV